AAVFDSSHVPNQHRLAVDQLHHCVANGLDSLGDGIRINVGVELRVDEYTRGQERVRLGDRGRNVTGRQTASLGCNRIHDQIDLSLATAVERSAGDTWDALEQRLYAVQAVVIELRSRETAAIHGDLDDGRVRWVELQYERGKHTERLRHGAHGKCRLLLDEGLSSVEIRAPLHPHPNDTQVVARDTLDVIDPRSRAHVLLDPPGQRFLHVFRAKTRRQRAHDQHRGSQLRKGIDGHARRDDHRKHDQADGEHQDRNRVSERKAGHRASRLAAAPLETAAGAPLDFSTLDTTLSLSLSSARPSVTTRDPGARLTSRYSRPSRSPFTSTVRLCATSPSTT